MSKKTNTVLFILGGTILNIFVTVLSFLVFLVIYSRFLYPKSSDNIAAWVLPVIFLASILVSFLVYRLVIKIIIKKVDMNKHFDPILGARGHKSAGKDAEG